MRIRQTILAWGLVVTCAGSAVQAQAARLADGTAVHVRLTADLLSSQAGEGARVDFEIAEPVTLQGVVVIPPGSVAWGAVQTLRKGKILHFDVEGVRLPNQQIVKLRCSPQRTNRAAKDEIKVETQVGGDLGAAKGSEFTAYLDQDVTVDVPGAPAPPSPVVAPAAEPHPATPTPAPVAAPKPVAVAPLTPKPEPPPAPPSSVAASPVVSAPVAPAAAPVAHPAPAALPGEYITVECFSEPTHADIWIDDEFHGSTPSILKLLPGNHRIEYRLMGYKAQSKALNLTPALGLQTVRMDLEKQP